MYTEISHLHNFELGRSAARKTYVLRRTEQENPWGLDCIAEGNIRK
jgi:hypothetical protein